jgi:uncharacterized membrane protein YkvA (DUF1232 family)
MKEKYSKHYSEKSFWRKVRKYGKKAGREVVEKALWLFYASMNAEMPREQKLMILGALGYFILPFDLIPDFIPVVGYGDDLAALAAAVRQVLKYIDDDVKRKTDEKLDKWFGPKEGRPRSKERS